MRTQCVGELIRGVDRVVHEVVVRVGELDEQHASDRSLGLAELRDLLRNAVFENLEVVLFQAGDELAVFGHDADRHLHFWNVHTNGEIGHSLGILRGRGSTLTLRRSFVFLLRDGHGPGIARRSSRFWSLIAGIRTLRLRVRRRRREGSKCKYG